MVTRVVTCVGVDFDLALLPHFIKHYAHRGADVFHVILNTNVAAGHRIEVAKQMLSASGVDFTTRDWYGEFNAGRKRQLMSVMLLVNGNPGDVFVTVDVDEFMAVRNIAKAYEAPVVYGRLIDRFAAEPGRLAAVLPDVDIFKQFPVTRHNFSARVCGMQQPFKACIQGYAPYGGIHQYKGYGYKRWCKNGNTPIRLHHFKWTEGRIEKSTRRKEMHEAKHKRAAARRSARVLRAIKKGS